MRTAPESVHDGWPVSGLEAEGIDPRPIAVLLKRVKTGSYVGIDGLLLARNGKLVSELYFNGFGRERWHQTRSAFKSVAGLLVGIAVAEGRLDLDDLVAPLIARYHTPSDDDPRKRDITIRDLLRMASGLDCSEMPGTGPHRESAINDKGNSVAANFDLPMAGASGITWRYCSSNTFLLGVALKSALARDGLGSLKDYVDSRLINPLSISYLPAFSGEGHFSMKGGQKLRPRDLAKFGQLLVSGGRWHGRQLVPAEWIAEILSDGMPTDWSWTSAVAPGPAMQRQSSYRYQWFHTEMWVAGGDYRLIHAWGNGGQFVVAVPQLDLVVVTTGSNYGSRNIEKQKQIFHMLYRYILPAAAGTAAR